jgi:GNAT superfamily N-acetyltransferase
MPTRLATADDAAEIVRLASVMYTAMGVEVTDEWACLAETQLRSRLGDDVVAVVSDDPDRPGALRSSGCGVISRRLLAPSNLSGEVGYIQWVCTDAAHRRQGLSTEVMEGLLAWFVERAVRVVELHATEDGEPVYRRLGFSEGGLALRRRLP